MGMAHTLLKKVISHDLERYLNYSDVKWDPLFQIEGRWNPYLKSRLSTVSHATT